MDTRREWAEHTVEDICRKIGCPTPSVEWKQRPPNTDLAELQFRPKMSWRELFALPVPGRLLIDPSVLSLPDATVRYRIAKVMAVNNPRWLRLRMNFCLLGLCMLIQWSLYVASLGSNHRIWTTYLMIFGAPALVSLLRQLEESPSMFAVGVIGDVEPAIAEMSQLAQKKALNGGDQAGIQLQLEKEVAAFRRLAIRKRYVQSPSAPSAADLKLLK